MNQEISYEELERMVKGIYNSLRVVEIPAEKVAYPYDALKRIAENSKIWESFAADKQAIDFIKTLSHLHIVEDDVPSILADAFARNTNGMLVLAKGRSRTELDSLLSHITDSTIYTHEDRTKMLSAPYLVSDLFRFCPENARKPFADRLYTHLKEGNYTHAQREAIMMAPGVYNTLLDAGLPEARLDGLLTETPQLSASLRLVKE